MRTNNLQADAAAAVRSAADTRSIYSPTARVTAYSRRVNDRPAFRNHIIPKSKLMFGAYGNLSVPTQLRNLFSS